MAALAPMAALAGCASTTHTVYPTDALGDANRALGGRPVTVLLVDGTAHAAEAIRLEADSTSWIDPQTGALYAVPTDAVRVVERRDHKRSTERVAGRGAIIGTIVGAVLMGAAGYDTGGCLVFCSEPSGPERIRGAATWGALGAGSGAISGLFWGTIVGVFSDPTERFVVEGNGALTEDG